MNHNQQQNNFMQDDNYCENDYKIVPGIGKICIYCGESQGQDYQKEERIKPLKKLNNLLSYPQVIEKSSFFQLNFLLISSFFQLNFLLISSFFQLNFLLISSFFQLNFLLISSFFQLSD
jgi:hypothetical protein